MDFETSPNRWVAIFGMGSPVVAEEGELELHIFDIRISDGVCDRFLFRFVDEDFLLFRLKSRAKQIRARFDVEGLSAGRPGDRAGRLAVFRRHVVGVSLGSDLVGEDFAFATGREGRGGHRG